MNNIHDHEQREQALHPHQSFIVQAPAGSGKTELITQRFLVLLSYVNKPEEILAITFTKKSAAEMRNRIIHALTDAITDIEPTSPHKKRTWKLAKKALQRNDDLHWDLLDNPNRLRIQTIDSFNVSLTRQLPILSNFGATPDIADDPFFLYQEAVHELLSHLEEDVPWADSIAQLLTHMDNDLNKVAMLLMNLLAKRDQWLRYITLHATDPELRNTLESHLASILMDALKALEETFPKQYVDELISLARFSASNLLNAKIDSPIVHCEPLSTLPGKNISDKEAWLGLSTLLLTNDLEWRKRFDASIGFPASSAAKNKEEKLQLTEKKQRMSDLLEKLREHDVFRLMLIEFKKMPEPRYQASQWKTLEALHHVLRIAVAQLKVTFQQYGKIDYIENAQAAITALGTEDDPTDISLALDYKIQHILIDEFQDTSNSQYALLEKLIAGWQKGDGRTLFIVGDPMQSIYRFREAEVGIFIRTRHLGIGNISLKPLTLAVNFRSTPNIVNWINDHFKIVLPSSEDIATGAVSYSHSMAHHIEHEMNRHPILHPFIDEDPSSQANKIVSIIQESKIKNPSGSIAILVRSRTHLKDIIPALKKSNLLYRAIDIDPLITRPIIQDLMALTKALLSPTHRIAWFSILRSPWCGFSLKDLLVIAGSNSNDILSERLKMPEIIDQLTHEGKNRLARVWPILERKMMERCRYSLRRWIESTWLMLGGPACIDQETDLQDANAFFNLLEKLDEGGEIKQIEKLDENVSRLYASANTQTDNTLQIMTIHNAKGLEFDTVILPHLERKSPNDDKQLLLWMERARLKNNNVLILAPVHAIGEENDSIYDYIKRQHAIKTDHENGRLLYVAATRAKKDLHLLFHAEKPEKSSLLNKIWPAIQEKTNTLLKDKKASLPLTSFVHAIQTLKRLSLAWQSSLQENDGTHPFLNFHENSIEISLPTSSFALIGTIVHQILQQMTIHGISWWESQHTEIQRQYLEKNFMRLGLSPKDFSYASLQIEKAIKNVVSDPKGQWILKPHTEGKTELSITTLRDNDPKQFVIDRTFIDETGTRWIIDYKTDAFSGESLEDFLNKKQMEHQAQLFEYKKALQAMDERPIRMALYFPLIPAWWEIIGSVDDSLTL